MTFPRQFRIGHEALQDSPTDSPFLRAMKRIGRFLKTATCTLLKNKPHVIIPKNAPATLVAFILAQLTYATLCENEDGSGIPTSYPESDQASRIILPPPVGGDCERTVHIYVKGVKYKDGRFDGASGRLTLLWAHPLIVEGPLYSYLWNERLYFPYVFHYTPHKPIEVYSTFPPQDKFPKLIAIVRVKFANGVEVNYDIHSGSDRPDTFARLELEKVEVVPGTCGQSDTETRHPSEDDYDSLPDPPNVTVTVPIAPQLNNNINFTFEKPSRDNDYKITWKTDNLKVNIDVGGITFNFDTSVGNSSDSLIFKTLLELFLDKSIDLIAKDIHENINRVEQKVENTYNTTNIVNNKIENATNIVENIRNTTSITKEQVNSLYSYVDSGVTQISNVLTIIRNEIEALPNIPEDFIDIIINRTEETLRRISRGFGSDLLDKLKKKTKYKFVLVTATPNALESRIIFRDKSGEDVIFAGYLRWVRNGTTLGEEIPIRRDKTLIPWREHATDFVLIPTNYCTLTSSVVEEELPLPVVTLLSEYENENNNDT